jgi:hypothetical protein
MALMPDTYHREALARLTGLLADIPFTREWHIPTGKVITDGRLPVPADVMEEIFWHAAGAPHRPMTSRPQSCSPGCRSARRTGCW